MHLLESRYAGDGVLHGLRDLLGHVGRAGTRVRGHDRHHRKIDVREEFLLEAAPGGDPGDEKGACEEEHDAPLAEGDAAETVHERFSLVMTVMRSVWRRRRRRGQAVDRSIEDRDRLVDAGELLGIEPAEQPAKLALVELPKTLEEVVRLRVGEMTTWRRSWAPSPRSRSSSSTRRSTSSLADDVPMPSRAASSDIRSRPAAVTT